MMMEDSQSVIYEGISHNGEEGGWLKLMPKGLVYYPPSYGELGDEDAPVTAASTEATKTKLAWKSIVACEAARSDNAILLKTSKYGVYRFQMASWSDLQTIRTHIDTLVQACHSPENNITGTSKEDVQRDVSQVRTTAPEPRSALAQAGWQDSTTSFTSFSSRSRSEDKSWIPAMTKNLEVNRDRPIMRKSGVVSLHERTLPSPFQSEHLEPHNTEDKNTNSAEETMQAHRESNNSIIPPSMTMEANEGNVESDVEKGIMMPTKTSFRSFTPDMGQLLYEMPYQGCTTSGVFTNQTLHFYEHVVVVRHTTKWLCFNPLYSMTILPRFKIVNVSTSATGARRWKLIILFFLLGMLTFPFGIWLEAAGMTYFGVTCLFILDPLLYLIPLIFPKHHVTLEVKNSAGRRGIMAWCTPATTKHTYQVSKKEMFESFVIQYVYGVLNKAVHPGQMLTHLNMASLLDPVVPQTLQDMALSAGESGHRSDYVQLGLAQRIRAGAAGQEQSSNGIKLQEPSSKEVPSTGYGVVRNG